MRSEASLLFITWKDIPLKSGGCGGECPILFGLECTANVDDNFGKIMRLTLLYISI